MNLLTRPNLMAMTLLFSLVSSSDLLAITPEEKGYDVAAQSDRTDRGFGDSVVDITMVLRSEQGEETRRSMLQRTQEVPSEDTGDRTLILFSKPEDIAGTALLSHTKILKADDQWLYLPAFKRVKRVASVNKDGAFVGSEFAFEDFTALELNKYDYRYIDSEACEERTCDVIERIPRYEYSGYSRQVAWIDQDIYQVHKVEFFDRAGERIKTLKMSDYKQYENSVWRPHKMEMVNHKTGKSTDLLFSSYQFDNGFSRRDFDKSILDRLN